MFSDEELASFYGMLKKTDHVEIECGCTVPKYGDNIGKLRIYVDGKIEVDCNCSRSCSKVKLHPIEFAKHAGKSNSREAWKGQVWVTKKDGKKVALKWTCLLKYHTSLYERPVRQTIHRDEFVGCCTCHKQRRFTLRDEVECRIYHDAVNNKNWKCSDMPNNQLCCNDEAERECRMVNKGCPRNSKCQGCLRCACLGCNMCRFEDCPCQQCVEYFNQNM